MRRRARLLLIPLALVFLASGLIEAWRDAPTVDESIDIAAGVTSLVRHDLRLMPEHGVLTRVLPAVPALLAHPVVPDGPGFKSGDWFDHTDEFVRANTAAGRLHRVVFLSRLVPLLEGLAIVWLLYLLGARLFGESAGVLAAGLWLTTPVFVGIGHLVSIDVAFTLATLGVSLALLTFLEAPSQRRAIVVGLASGAALLTRHLGLVLLVVAIAVVAMAGVKRARRVALRHAAIVALVSWATVWIVVRVLASPSGGAAGSRLDHLVSAARGDSLSESTGAGHPVAQGVGGGFRLSRAHSNGETGLPLRSGVERWALVVLPRGRAREGPAGRRRGAAGRPVRLGRVPRADARKAMAVIAIPAIALYVTLAAQPLDLGLRYAFPVLALWFVAAGPIVLLGRPLWRRVGAGALIVTQLAAIAVAYPHSIVWTPPPFQPAYRYTTDSNVDYGQDNGRVEDWAVGRAPLVDLLLPRGVDPPPGSRALLDVPVAEVRGWVAVSPTRLETAERDTLSWLRAYCPVATIGGSVLVYRFIAPVDPRPGPTMPVGLCSGGASIEPADGRGWRSQGDHAAAAIGWHQPVAPDPAREPPALGLQRVVERAQVLQVVDLGGPAPGEGHTVVALQAASRRRNARSMQLRSRTASARRWSTST